MDPSPASADRAAWEAFRSRHRALLAELFGEVRALAQVYALEAETFSVTLFRSAQKAGCAAGAASEKAASGEKAAPTERAASSEKAAPDEKVAACLRALRLPDLALASACAAGSEKAWEILLATQRGSLRNAARSMAGDRGEELADSLFGELYAKRATKLASYAGRSSLAGWLRAVLQQTFVDRLRAEKRIVQIDDDHPEPAAPAQGDLLEQSQNARIVRGALGEALAALPPRQKLLLDFYYAHHLTLREAAALVGVHEATASRELDRARAALKEKLLAILRREYGLDARAAEALLLGWDGAQESGVAGVLLKERL